LLPRVPISIYIRVSHSRFGISARKEGNSSMSGFDNREKAFEAKFQQDQEHSFKVQARRNFLFGKWAAEKLGLTGGDADVYAKDVVSAEFRETGDQDVLQKVSVDLKSKGIAVSDHILRVEMDRLLETAREQIDGDS